jgi:hypothetical protein
MDGYQKRELDLKDKFYLAQVNNESCFNQVIDLYKKYGDTFINLVKEVRSTLPPWSTSINQTSLSKKDITLYSEDQLIPFNNYLFDFGDIDYLLSIEFNPYTGDYLPVKFISELNQLKKDRRYLLRIYPLDLSLKGLVDSDTWCPDVRFIKTDTSDTVYVSNPLKPIDFDQDKKDKRKLYTASLFYDKRPWNENYVYKVTLKVPKKKLGQNPYHKNIRVGSAEIKSVELIHDPTQFSPPFVGKPAMPLTNEMVTAIFGYHNTMDGKRRYIRPNVIEQFKKHKFHEQKPMKLYRGLQISGRFFNNLTKVKMGDIIYLPSDQVSSWTTNRCVAEKYSMFSSGRGIVVSSVIDPKDMILDSRFIRQEDYAKYNRKDNDTLFWQYQNEILVKPGNYPLKVESILHRAGTEYTPYTWFQNEQYRSDLNEGWDQYPMIRFPTVRTRKPPVKKSVIRRQPVKRSSTTRKPPVKKSVIRRQPVKRSSTTRKPPVKKSVIRRQPVKRSSVKK